MSEPGTGTAPAGRRPAPMTREAAVAEARRQAKALRGFYQHATAYVVVVLALWLINWITDPRHLWAGYTTVGWGIGLAIQGLSVFAGRSFFGHEWQERKVAEWMARERLRAVSQENQAVRAQLRLLQAQIEPHFLFNTLATVQSLIPRAPERAEQMLDGFIAYLRQSLASSRADRTTLGDEFTLLDHYLRLMQIRMGPRLAYTLELPPELAAEAFTPMLLQPLVENAIRHGLEPKIEGGQVSVRVRRAQGPTVQGIDAAPALDITIEDNGLGFGQNPDSAGTGVGLAHTRERLRLLYDGEATLTIADAEPGTRITLRVPSLAGAVAAAAAASTAARTAAPAAPSAAPSSPAPAAASFVVPLASPPEPSSTAAAATRP